VPNIEHEVRRQATEPIVYVPIRPPLSPFFFPFHVNVVLNLPVPCLFPALMWRCLGVQQVAAGMGGA